MVMNLAPRRIGLVGFEGVNGLHLTGAAELFMAAALDNGYGGRIPCYETVILGLRNVAFRAESGLVLRPHKTLRAGLIFDTVIVPAGAGLRDPEVSGKISTWLLREATKTRRVAALGESVYCLAQTGLLTGRAVTTHWRCARGLAERFPALRVDHKKPVVQDGPFCTAAGGLTAGIDLARQLIADDFGPQMVLSLEREMARPSPSGTGQGRATELAHFSDQGTLRFADLVAWMLRNLEGDLSVPVLARRACMCADSFTRSFRSVFGTSPARFVENLRLHEARRRLSTSRRIVQSVARSVGYTDSGAFGRDFTRHFGTRPLGPPLPGCPTSTGAG